MAYSRIFNCTRGFVAVAALALAAALPALKPAEAVPSYDGLWSVVIVTEQGLCDRAYRAPIRISQGDKSATGTGRLSGKSGAGSWSGGPCAGTWQAERRS
jgi:hypothetical protein